MPVEAQKISHRNQMDATEGLCFGCGVAALRPITQRKSLAVLRCTACGLVVGREVRPSGTDDGTVVVTDPNHFTLLRGKYPEHLATTRKMLERRMPVYQQHLKAAPRFWLEIGPGNGVLADILPRFNCRWTGVEFDSDMATLMKAEGKNVFHADFAAVEPTMLMESGEEANSGFDLITFSQVLEHVREPRAFLDNAFAALRPGGLLHLDVPNHHGLTARLRQANPLAVGYGEIVPPHHMIAYSAPTLRSALMRAGFEIIDLFGCVYNHAVFGLVHSHMARSPKMRAVWALSGILGGGGNLVALARKPG